MKKMNFAQMENVQGGCTDCDVDWCVVTGGISAFGWVGLAAGLTTGGVGLGVIGACTAYNAMFC